MSCRKNRVRRHGFIVLPLAALVASGLLGHLVSAPAAEACPIPGAHAFIRGELNGDGAINISDPIYLLTNLFVSPVDAPISCDDAADVNDDEAVNIADALFLLDYLFAGTATIPAPFPGCGPDGGQPVHLQRL